MIALLLAIIPYSPIIETQCDVYEVNRVYNDDAQIVLTQRIAWRLPDVLGWRIVHRRDCRLDSRRVLFWDGKDGPVLRVIRFNSRVESHTNYDPEMDARNELPEAERRGLGEKP